MEESRSIAEFSGIFSVPLCVTSVYTELHGEVTEIRREAV